MSQEILEKVCSIVSEQLSVEAGEVKSDSNFQNDLGADSLDTVELVMALEEAFDNLLTRNENGWTSNKTPRRELIAEKYRVIFQVGDNLGDFVDEEENKISSLARKEIVRKYQEHWGKTWFVIENPTYGDWEGSLYNYDFNQPRSVISDIRRKALDEK